MILRNSTPHPREEIETLIRIASPGLALHSAAVWVKPIYASGSSVRVYDPAPRRVKGFPSASAFRYLVVIGLHHGMEGEWWRIALDKAVKEAITLIQETRKK